MKFLIAAMLWFWLVPADSQAQPSAQGWAFDLISGCRVMASTIASETDNLTWRGGCKDGQAEGAGTLTFFLHGAPVADASGQWHLGKQSGWGKHTTPNGDSLEAEFKDGVANGRGIFRRADGDRFEGEFKAGKREGHGVYLFADGGRYDGEFSNDQQSGRGTYAGIDGSVYEGDWLLGKKHGEGVIVRVNGD